MYTSKLKKVSHRLICGVKVNTYIVNIMGNEQKHCIFKVEFVDWETSRANAMMTETRSLMDF